MKRSRKGQLMSDRGRRYPKGLSATKSKRARANWGKLIGKAMYPIRRRHNQLVRGMYYRPPWAMKVGGKIRKSRGGKGFITARNRWNRKNPRVTFRLRGKRKYSARYTR